MDMKPTDIDQLIESALGSEPEFKLKADFKDQVVRVIKKREQNRQRKFYLFLGLSTFLMTAIGIVFTINYIKIASIEVQNSFLPLAISLGLMLVVFQYLDKRLVKDRFFKQPV